MRGGGHIGEVSVPFTLGIAAGDILLSHLPFHQSGMAASSAVLLCAAVMAAQPYCRRRRTASIAFAFLALGIFCSLSYGLCATRTGDSSLAATAGQCLAMFKGLISEIPFQHESTAQLMTALLTGDRSGLTPETVNAFRDSGASHILALSGLHLGVIYLMAGRVLSLAGNSPAALRIRSFFLVTLSGFYSIMTGAGPSIVRAFLFILLSETGRLSPERKRDPGRTLLAALTIQLAINPSVIGSPGFQLSYLAMTGIVTVYPWMSSWYPDGTAGPIRKIWDSTALTVSCQLFTAPLIWYRFRTFPKYFIITNLLALPLTTAVMTVSVTALCLYSAGICPEILIEMADKLVQTLVFVLECISGM